MKRNVKKMVLIAMLAALAYIAVLVIRIPVVLFLSYEPKDVVITIGGFLLGPMAAFACSAVVSLIEMFSISETGMIGWVMNLLSTCSFACIAALIYKKRHDLTGEMTVSDRRFDPQQDLVFEETETGYRYYLPGEDWKEGFYICAREGSGMLNYNYIHYFYGNVADFIAGEYAPDEKEGTELLWRKLPNGDYVLSAKADDTAKYFTHAGTLERAE